MKKTYPTSTKSQQWAKHLRPYGKTLANKSTRKINKEITKQDDEDLAMRPKASRKKKAFAIEYHSGNLRWSIWKKYIVEGRRNKSLENLIKKHKNSTYEFMNQYKFRALDLKK